MEGVQEDGPPRKRINRGPSLDPSHDVYDVADSPLSPEIQCAGQRRHIVNNLLDSLSSCSDDSLPDISEIVAGPSNPLIVNGRPSTPNISPAGDPKFTHFMTTIPLASPTQVQNSWIQAQGDVKKDAELRFDSFWVDPRKYQGIVKETKVATKAQRMAAKERGKESMIYANRSVLEGKPGISAPPVSKRGIGLNFPSFPMDSSTSYVICSMLFVKANGFTVKYGRGSPWSVQR
jgi:SWI/SNF-related matrix-associated actin-dependent regulator 1 of chromatin subfamily A